MNFFFGSAAADNRRTRRPSLQAHSKNQTATQASHSDAFVVSNDEDEDNDAFEDAQESWNSDGASQRIGLSRHEVSYDSAIASASSPPQAIPSRSSSTDCVRGPQGTFKAYFPGAVLPDDAEVAADVRRDPPGGWPETIKAYHPGAVLPNHIEDAADDVQYPHKCDDCEKHQKVVYYCNVCKSSFCEACWNTQFVHKRVRDGVPHERTDPAVAQKVHNVLSPPTDGRERERLYKADEATAWFGIERPEDNSPPVFQDYGRFSDLMGITDPLKKQRSFVEQWTPDDRDRRTPSLVSFVGQTGAGKSTLVKLLVDFSVSGEECYSTPVVGPRGAHLPTSEDVHLYLDPRTADSLSPLLYADCEGLEGGEREPLGAKFKKKRRMDNSKLSEDETLRADTSSSVVSERELEWASGPRSSTREFAVTNLYPRLLYTFSDVIVFVLRNPRTIEHVFVQLVKWAASAIETSSNQPVLPHAIIALNASEHDIHPNLWDVRFNTETILEDLANTVSRNDTFKKWSQFWRERGKTINNLEELLLCYYSSIQIVRLPTEGRPKLMAEQVEKLYNGTLSACVASRSARHNVRMLLDVDDLQAYLQEAFNHYCSTLESPFDFVQASFRNSPIPQDFGGNILKLALSMVELWENEPKVTGERIFSELSYMVASCIMLDSARHNNKEFLQPALAFAKGHQSIDGKVFATGDYESSWSWEENENEFPNMVYRTFVELMKELTNNEPGTGVEDQPNGATEVKILECPIEGGVRRYHEPWTVHLKPKSAGVRILTLDGGGIRGIVELEMLLQIQETLGNIPIQCFFDLIVGTFVENYHHSKYQTSTLEDALKAAFPSDLNLFGGARPASSSTPAKVAVTTASISANNTYLLTNYNHPRASPKQKHYQFQRPEALSSELKVWEAARATTAAPRYFKSFHHAPSRKTYIDGAIFHNNPVRLADSERKILWPDHSFPDIFLSLGTGYSVGVTRAESEHLAAARRGIFNHGRTLYKILRSNMDQTLNCERTWEDYFSTVASSLPRHISTSRFIRINPEIGQVPALDEKDKMPQLRKKTNEAIRRDPRIEEVGRQLIATCFYFELMNKSESGQVTIHGKLQCRLAQGSQEIHELGKQLRQRFLSNEPVSFAIYEEGDVKPIQTIILDERKLEAMVTRKRFDLGRSNFEIRSKVTPVHIDMYFGTVSKHPISGFPRSFFDEDTYASLNGASHKMITSSMSTRYTHGSRRAKSGGTWQPQDLGGTSSSSNLMQYANPTLTLGDEDLDDLMSPKLPKSAEPSEYPHKSANGTTPHVRKGGIRDAFKALLIPLNTRRMDTEHHSLLSPSKLSLYELPEHGFFSRGRDDKTTLDEQVSMAQSYYNVPPEDYAVYRQWVNLLQPNTANYKKPWAPSVGPELSGHDQSNAPGEVFEMPGDTMFPVEMGSREE
ncbi:hypothetical protein G7054_g4138 [Neopestalotiopsis clavispora]|nr:hypothetical protein G7054_g4138 [Neopestalotiopsis clavispora]